MRKLKHHEEKLLKKVDFLNYHNERNDREAQIIRRYMIQKREDYSKYNKIAGLVKKLTNMLKELPPTQPFRIKSTELLLEKLYLMGLITSDKSLSSTDKITASAFCRRRLPVVMCRLRMAENLKEAITFIEQGHVRVGPDTITDPAFLVTRTMEDFVTWVDSSKIRHKIARYNDRVDDYDLLGL